jgi:hypothetical protein
VRLVPLSSELRAAHRIDKVVEAAEHETYSRTSFGWATVSKFSGTGVLHCSRLYDIVITRVCHTQEFPRGPVISLPSAVSNTDVLMGHPPSLVA